VKLLGAILAGGQSTRFGSDKAEALLGGVRLIDHTATALAGWAAKVIVVGRTDTSYTSVPDLPRADLGPLGGLCGALHYAGQNGYDAVLTMPCDVPELPETAARILIDSLPSVVAEIPVVGCWPAKLAGEMRDYLLADNRRAVTAWAEHVRAVRISVPQLTNINTLEDLAAAARE
jgi:molybdopterin-guanine dinucleotide biosynthesis protein A